MTNNIILGWSWWITLVIISLFNNVYLLNYFFRNEFNSDQYKAILFAITYTIVCALRSFFPKKEACVPNHAGRKSHLLFALVF